MMSAREALRAAVFNFSLAWLAALWLTCSLSGQQLPPIGRMGLTDVYCGGQA